MENNYGKGLYQDGVFYFTNPTNEDFTALWNNKEYTFKAKTTVPLVIAGEPPENIQTIRRKFAFKLAQWVFHNSKKYKELVKKGGYIPATYDEDSEFMETIQACLTPLPKSQAEVKELPRDNENNYKGTKAIKSGQDLNKVFEDYQIPEIGTVN
jgi:hypothetical protein